MTAKCGPKSEFGATRLMELLQRGLNIIALRDEEIHYVVILDGEEIVFGEVQSPSSINYAFKWGKMNFQTVKDNWDARRFKNFRNGLERLFWIIGDRVIKPHSNFESELIPVAKLLTQYRVNPSDCV